MFKHNCDMFLFVSIYGEIIKVERLLNKIYVGRVVYEISAPTWTVCVEHCSRMPICKSINFIACHRLCQIDDAEAPGISNMYNSTKDVYVSTSSSSKNLAGSCRNNDCTRNQLCIEIGSSYTCITQTFMKCGPDGVLFRGHCYYVVAQKFTWTEAQTVCEHLGTSLVKIDDECENTLLTNILTDLKVIVPYWIGLNDRQKEDTWLWISDNSLVTYTNWSPGSPDNRRNNEHCGVIYGRLWHDLQCDLEILSICEGQAELEN